MTPQPFLSQLPRLVARNKKRLGRGHGSGKVKTSGRGTKGQKARDSIPRGFEGGQLPLIKRLPLLRGKGRNGSQKKKALALPVAKLASLAQNTNVTIATLKKEKLIAHDVAKVKLVGKGVLTIALKVSIPASGSARAVIVKAGGTVE